MSSRNNRLIRKVTNVFSTMVLGNTYNQHRQNFWLNDTAAAEPTPDSQIQQKLGDVDQALPDAKKATNYYGLGRGLDNYNVDAKFSSTGKSDKNILSHVASESIPYFTFVILIINSVLLIWPLVIEKSFIKFTKNPLLGPSVNALYTMGAKWLPGMINGGQWWRLISPMFLHSGLLHLIFNNFSFYTISKNMEVIHGRMRLIPIYLLSGYGGNCFSAYFLPETISVGASGAIFGFNGLLLVDLINCWKSVENRAKNLTFLMFSILVSFAIGFAPQIDNYAHLGGFVTGLVSGFVFLPSMRIGDYSIKMRIVQFSIALPLMLFVVIFFPFYFYMIRQTQ